ncbi:hypothetical protein EC988_001215 [Linderina pennispora]|nr:hypothetical protein EC988_001215 [Linderina pennispora]
MAAAKPTFHVFGDSLSDIGTLKLLTFGIVPPPPYWNGRFSSGPVWNEYLALKLGYNLYNRAIGGATSVNNQTATLANGDILQVPSSQDQINYFKFLHPLYKLDPSRSDDIAALVIGPNDYFGVMTDIKSGKLAPEAFATKLSDTIVGQLEQLKDIGFKNIIVGNVAAIQETPLAVSSGTVEAAKATIPLTNKLIQQKASAWAKTAGLTLFSVADLGAFVQLTVKQSLSSALGLVTTTKPCVNLEKLSEYFSDGNILQGLIDLLTNLGEVICSNPTEHYFMDPVHPAERVQRLFGYYMYEAIHALRSGSSFDLNEANLLSLIGKFGLNTAAPKPAAI